MQSKPEHRALSVQGHHSQRETLTDLGDVDPVCTYNALAIVQEVARFFVLVAPFRAAVSAALRRRNGCRNWPARCRASLKLGSPAPHDLALHRCEFGRRPASDRV